jgi:site-specific DNA-methyltransferase (adenine-specific)
VTVTLHQGDALRQLREIETASVDIVCTDPPYFLPAQAYVGTRDRSTYRRRLADVSILEEFFAQVFNEMFRVLKSTGTAYVFCDGQSYPVFYCAMIPHCKNVRPLVWDKTTSYNGYTWRHQHELILWGERDDALRVPTGDGDILRCRAVPVKTRRHPAEKPVQLLERLLGKHEGDVVLDPFCGSGSTGVAAQNVGKQFVGVELDPEYADRAQRRLDAWGRNDQIALE